MKVRSGLAGALALLATRARGSAGGATAQDLSGPEQQAVRRGVSRLPGICFRKEREGGKGPLRNTTARELEVRSANLLDAVDQLQNPHAL